MPDRYLTSPFRVTGPLRLAQLSVVVSADALVRRTRAWGRSADLLVCTLAGGLAGQTQVERELAREGHDRSTIGREAFVERVRAVEATNRAHAQSELDALAVGADLESTALNAPTAVAAARTAFVRLFEAGLLVNEERVVELCTRCETVVDRADAHEEALPAEVLHLVIGEEASTIAVDVVSPEFLPGTVAVVVPENHPAAGTTVEVPMAGPVPVVGDKEIEAPRLVFPAHDPEDLALARRLGAPAVPVLERDGTVIAPGPLHGLGRFAARQAAARVLSDLGAVESTSEGSEPGGRCRRCATVLVPHLGPHWFLPMADLEVAAADAVRDGVLEVVPASARDAFLERAGAGGDWCLSHQVWAGEPVPAAVCADCRQTTVAIDLDSTCHRCMGTLEPVPDVLDVRFVAAVWPLSVAGWPEGEGGDEATTVLVVDPPGVARWAVPWAAVGLRLTGAVPFHRVAAQESLATDDDPDPLLTADVSTLLEHEPVAVLRAALVAGGLDLDHARRLVQSLDSIPAGDADVEALVQAYDAAFAAGTPAAALDALRAAVAEGVRPESVERIKALAAPVTGG